MVKGMLIAVEGVDGSGKNTQAIRLAERLRSEGSLVELLGFPDYQGSLTGPKIGKMLSGAYGSLVGVHPIFTSGLFAIERSEKREKLNQSIAEGRIVICDRYVYSNAAHQACRLKEALRNDFVSWIETLEFDVLKMPRPTITVLLDLADEDSKTLREARSVHSYSGSVLDEHERDVEGISAARRIYKELAKRLDWSVVNCSSRSGVRNIDEISADVVEVVARRRANDFG